MGVAGRVECKSSGKRRKKEEKGDLWYAGRIGRNEGIFLQVLVREIDWEPSFLVEETEVETVLHVFTGKLENISMVIDRREIDRERTFEYFDPELSIYTVNLVFI